MKRSFSVAVLLMLCNHVLATPFFSSSESQSTPGAAPGLVKLDDFKNGATVVIKHLKSGKFFRSENGLLRASSDDSSDPACKFRVEFVKINLCGSKAEPNVYRLTPMAKNGVPVLYDEDKKIFVMFGGNSDNKWSGFVFEKYKDDFMSSGYLKYYKRTHHLADKCVSFGGYCGVADNGNVIVTDKKLTYVGPDSTGTLAAAVELFAAQ